MNSIKLIMKAFKIFANGMAGWSLGLLLLAMAMFTACQSESRGFVLPDGDEVIGKQLFVEMNCDRCHSIGDIRWSGSERYSDPYVKLGGETSTVKTYGELVTSVINPSHKIERKSLNKEKTTLVEGMSKMEMYRYNEIMTVEELVNLVSYLQSEYKLVVPENPYAQHAF